MNPDLPDLKSREGLHLALGGGAARALAHVGVLRALEEENIPIASICGTSMGSLVGAMYALHPDASHVRQTILEFVQGDIYHSARYKMLRAASKLKKKESSFRQFINSGVIIGRTIAFGSVIPFEDYYEEVKTLLPDKGFQNTEIPFLAVACELRNHKEILFHKGKLRWAIMASCAIPGIYPAIASKGHVYVDGSWMNLVPVLPLKQCGAERVFAISVGLTQIPITTDRTWKTVLHAFHASFNRLQERQLEFADLLITPDVKTLHWAAFEQFERAEELGYQCAVANMEAIKRLMDKPKQSFWRNWIKPKADKPQAKYLIEPEYRGIWEIEKI